MNRIARLFAIIGLMLSVSPLGVASAQQPGDLDLAVPEQLVLQSTLDLIRGDGQLIRDTIESPFADPFAGSAGVFAAIGESSAAAGQGLGDLIPFADTNVFSSVTSYRPASNDYFVNSPYTVANVVEVTVPVSGCGATEYREVALFLTRNGMAAIGDNPNVPNDPGVGATEAVSLVCTAGLTSTLFILPQGDGVTQFATPYHVFEFEIDGRHFVAFLTLDPFATYQVVASFATDTTTQEQFGFVRGETGTYPEAQDPGDESLLTDDDRLAIQVLLNLGSPAEDNPVSGVEDDQGETSDSDPQDQSDTGAAPTQDTPAPVNETAADQSATQPQTAEPPSEGGSSAVPAAIGTVAAAAVAGVGVAIYRKKKVVSRGVSGPLLSDSEEIRVAGERAGLPLVRGWQQVPFSTGREFSVRNGVTTRENLVGDDLASDVLFKGRPWQWNNASIRNLDLTEYFAFWINDEGTLRVGNPTEPYQYDRLRDESEYPADYSEEPEDDAAPSDHDPINLDDMYGGKGGRGIPPA